MNLSGRGPPGGYAHVSGRVSFLVAKVQFRVSDEAVDYLVKAGLNPNEVAREAFERAVRARRIGGRAERLKALGVTFRATSEEAARLVRESREER